MGAAEYLNCTEKRKMFMVKVILRFPKINQITQIKLWSVIFGRLVLPAPPRK